MAFFPLSQVLIRMTSSRLVTKILPSPILPLEAESIMASIACSDNSSVTATSILIFGSKST
jgi:hypothetical protein